MKSKKEEVIEEEMFYRGHEIVFSEKKDGKYIFVYKDTGDVVDEGKRACKSCGLVPEDNDIDPCLGKLPGVKFACCGHGNLEKAYITFDTDVTIRFFHTIEERHKDLITNKLRKGREFVIDRHDWYRIKEEKKV